MIAEKVKDRNRQRYNRRQRKDEISVYRKTDSTKRVRIQEIRTQEMDRETR